MPARHWFEFEHGEPFALPVGVGASACDLDFVGTCAALDAALGTPLSFTRVAEFSGTGAALTMGSAERASGGTSADDAVAIVAPTGAGAVGFAREQASVSTVNHVSASVLGAAIWAA